MPLGLGGPGPGGPNLHPHRAGYPKSPPPGHALADLRLPETVAGATSQS
jgi:hypothetical protein